VRRAGQFAPPFARLPAGQLRANFLPNGKKFASRAPNHPKFPLVKKNFFLKFPHFYCQKPQTLGDEYANTRQCVCKNQKKLQFF
jgi:hypothetical protein